MQVKLSLCPANYRFRIGDRAACVKVINRPKMAHIYRSHGVIMKIRGDRATLKFPNGRASSIPLKSLSPSGTQNELTRALSRRATRRSRRG
ncbi:hypothetical protein [Pseudomonas sp. NA-150]|uniref:hypothetical protein n=1 Tax=Pseudomonas sp. NA-150 TaxID=3367525 RepID=UPI0037C77845